MTTRRQALAGAGLLAAAPAAAAQASPEAQGYTLPFSAVIPLASRINGVAYKLYVRTPPRYDARRADGYPVIVTLDADYSFAICANHLDHLAERQGQAPEAILVSIAYDGDYPDRDRYRASRTRDYTPVFWPDGGYGERFQAASGGGPAFLDVIEREILPLIAARYHARADERTLVGHSYGGLLAAWALQTRPALFNRYLLVSPSLWYANGLVLSREAAGNAARLARKTRVYMGVGSWEEQPQNNRAMVSDLTRFAELLAARGDPNLVSECRVFEDETHASIFPAAFSTGIRHLFAAVS